MVLSANQKREEKTALVLVFPFLAIFAVFKLYPILYGIWVSLLGRNSIKTCSSTSFRGLDNYINVLGNPDFWSSMGKSICFSLIYTLFVMVVGLFLAMLLNRKFRSRTVVRTMFYLPYVTNIIAVGIVFKFLLNPTKGQIYSVQFSGCIRRL